MPQTLITLKLEGEIICVYFLMQRPTIEVITGCMFSGKSEELLRRLKRHRIAGHSLCIIKPAHDTRVETCVRSRSGAEEEAITVSYPADILNCVAGKDVVGIDEVHFFSPELVDVVQEVFSQGKIVLISGLDTDFSGQPFKTTALLMALAHKVTKLTAICAICKHDAANRNQLLVSAKGNRFFVGDSEYEPRCTNCFEATQVI